MRTGNPAALILIHSPMTNIPDFPIHTLAVMTSGGDAPGMNAALRAVVRRTLRQGLKVYGIRRGWLGVVEGGAAIEEMQWDSVGGILQRGGTILGTARCQRFRTREGRRQGAVNLYKLGVDALVVIGGDGSLTGALIFQQEWTSLLQEAADAGEIVLPDGDIPPLAIAGLPGSIDNDTYGSDMSIGADTALHRIVTAADLAARGPPSAIAASGTTSCSVGSPGTGLLDAKRANRYLSRPGGQAMKLRSRMVPLSSATSFEPRPGGRMRVSRAFCRQRGASRMRAIEFPRREPIAIGGE